jgi:hypothetical protein
MATLLRQLALVSEVSGVAFSEVTRVSAALQKQVSRDFGPIWDVTGTCDAFNRLEDVPIGYWPVIIRDDIDTPGAAGVHEDKDGQPFALVTAGDGWALTASHEALEMLADPFGNRVVAGDSPKPDQGRVEFLVEVCDPCEAEQFGYSVNGITLSDFYTPHYFDPVQADGVQYSFTGAITEPRQVLDGGYLSWHDPVSDHWWQLQRFGAVKFEDLGVLTAAAGPFRSQIDRHTDALAAKFRILSKAGLQGARRTAAAHEQSCATRAAMLRAQIAELLGQTKHDGTTAAETSAPREPPVRRPPRRGRAKE